MDKPRTSDVIAALYGAIVFLIFFLRFAYWNTTTCVAFGIWDAIILLPFTGYGVYLKTGNAFFKNVFYAMLIIFGILIGILVMNVLSSISFNYTPSFEGVAAFEIKKAFSNGDLAGTPKSWSEENCPGELVLKNRLPRSIKQETLMNKLDDEQLREYVGEVQFICEDSTLCPGLVEVFPTEIIFKKPSKGYLVACQSMQPRQNLILISANRSNLKTDCITRINSRNK